MKHAHTPHLTCRQKEQKIFARKQHIRFTGSWNGQLWFIPSKRALWQNL